MNGVLNEEGSGLQLMSSRIPRRGRTGEISTLTLPALVASIAAGRIAGGNPSSAIRVFILEHVRTRLEKVRRRNSSFGHGHGHGAQRRALISAVEPISRRRDLR